MYTHTSCAVHNLDTLRGYLHCDWEPREDVILRILCVHVDQSSVTIHVHHVHVYTNVHEKYCHGGARQGSDPLTVLFQAF